MKSFETQDLAIVRKAKNALYSGVPADFEIDGVTHVREIVVSVRGGSPVWTIDLRDAARSSLRPVPRSGERSNRAG